MDIYDLILKEIGLFLVRPSIKPSHRIYALGFLNKAGNILIADGNVQARATLLQIYFNLFNRLLH